MTILDYMEYATDGAAQTAYVSSDTGVHRYWRFIQTAITIIHAPRVCELRWKDETDTERTPDSFTHGGTFSYNEERWEYSFDGNTNTSDIGWIAGNTGWIRCDFGSPGFRMAKFAGFSSYGGAARGATWNIQWSDNDSDWTTIKSWDYETTTPYTGWFETSWTAQTHLQSYSESTIKTQGSYSLKGIAVITDSLNDTLTRTVDPTIDLSGLNKWTFWIYASRTGSNIKVGLHDTGGVTTEVTPNVLSADEWQKVEVDISGVADGNKDAIDSIIITTVNVDAENIFYLDNMYGGEIIRARSFGIIIG